MQMKLAGIVILYDPPENVFCNIATYIDDVDILYIFDNSPNYNNCIPAKYTEKAVYIHTGINEGIAKCLNQALDFTQKAGIVYLLTMDQDSSFNEGDMDQYLKLLTQEDHPETISMFGIRYYPLKKSEKEERVYNNLLITSGSIINIDAAIKMGGFDENLFIDGVDTEFCLKSFRTGLKTVCYNQICLKHLMLSHPLTCPLTCKGRVRQVFSVAGVAGRDAPTGCRRCCRC